MKTRIYIPILLTVLFGAATLVLGYTTPDTGVSWTMDDLVANSGGDVTGAAPNYQLHDDVWIEEADTLTIAAGTTITRDDAAGWFTLVIQGTLLAQGTESSPILITSSDLRGGDGDLDRALAFSGSAGSSNHVIEWVTFEKADYGLFINHSSPVTLKNCTFRDNNRGVYASGQITFDGCIIENNGSESRPLIGAGIAIDDYEVSVASVTLTNCTVRNNHAYGENVGGGIALRDGDLLVTDCTIVSNSAKWGGGFSADWLDVQSDIQILNSLVEANTATDTGGGIYLSDPNATASSMLVSNCTIRANGECSGAGIYAYKTSPEIYNCTIENNTTTTNSGNRAGGGIAFESVTNGIVSGCTIKDNEAQFGAGLYAGSSASLQIHDCSVSGNRYIDTEQNINGRGVHISISSEVEITSCESDDLLFLWQSEGTLRNCILSYMGMIDSSPLIANNYFTDPVYTVYLYGDSDPVIENNIFVKAAYLEINDAESNPMIRYNCFALPLNGNGVYKNQDDTWEDLAGLNALPGCTNNFSADPLFAGGTYGSDFHLKSTGGRWDSASELWVVDDATSPCIDAGNPNSSYSVEARYDYFISAAYSYYNVSDGIVERIWVAAEYANSSGHRINVGPYGNTIEASMSFYDYDSDGLTDVQELVSYPTNHQDSDSDNDGLKDGEEVYTYGTNPVDADSDDDGLNDRAEVKTHHTDPLLFDTDGEGLNDDEEINIYNTDPLKPDTDGDTLSDFEEINTHSTDPLLRDTDSDGLTDDVEINIHHTDPLVATGLEYGIG